ncbi:MAG: DNA polymerase III subunit alpha, partial [Ignavibacteria bacterium]
MEFGSLHTHSHFSFLDGASSPERLAHQAARLGHTAIVLSDAMGVYGAVRLQRACREVGIRPIIGADIQYEGGTVSFICQNEQGYHQLCMLLTELHQGSRTGEALDACPLHDCLAVVHSSSADDSVIRRISSKLNTAQIYIGIGHDARPWALHRARKAVALSESMSLPYVIAQDVRYACSDDYAAHDLMVCIREGITIHDPHPLRPVNDKQCLRSEQEIRALLPFEAGYQNLDRILSTCSFDILPERITPPSARIPEGRTSSEVLRELVSNGYDGRYQNSEPALRSRASEQLEHELQVLEELELCDFFLVVHEVVSESRRRGIRCSGRGSAANSIVAYVLGITGVCPIQHHLLFERFLHKGRKGTPDIDVDFDSDRRSEILSWMEERFGIEQTAMTATVITYRLRMAVRDAAKALGWPMETVSKLSKSVPSWSNHDIEHYRPELTSVVGSIPMLDILIRAAGLLVEHPRHLGQHSGGMVLSSKPLTMLTPLQRSANGVAIVQFDKDDVEAMGLVKFDVLGLRMLACISESVELIEIHHGHNIHIDDIALDDESTFSLIRSGKTLGVFQIESQGQMHLLAKHQPECFDDLVTEVALFRPGPLQGGMVHPYIARRTGKAPIEYVHPDLEPLLEDTLGIVLFQEQVLEIAHRFAGMPLDQADDFRSLVSKNRDRLL